MQITVPEVLKMWYFSCSAFWSTDQWGAIAPLLRPLWLCYCQKWSPRGCPWPRGHILKFLASKVKFLASKLQVFENCPDLGSRTALFFETLKFCWKTPETSRKIREDLYCFPQLEMVSKNFKTFFFRENLRLCPWSRDDLSSEGLSLASDFFCVLGLESCVLDCTSVKLIAFFVRLVA